LGKNELTHHWRLGSGKRRPILLSLCAELVARRRPLWKLPKAKPGETEDVNPATRKVVADSGTPTMNAKGGKKTHESKPKGSRETIKSNDATLSKESRDEGFKR